MISGKEVAYTTWNLDKSKIHWDRPPYLWHRDEFQFISEGNTSLQLYTSRGEQSYLLWSSTDYM